jgi:hypothetical protein
VIHNPHITEKTLTEDKTNVAATPQAIPAMVATVAAPVVLSQAPAIVPSDAKPVVDKPATVTAPTLETK